MEVGVVGKPNVGKSTFFNAATLANVEASSRPFTTINPNKGVSYVKIPCPCRELKVTCNPRNSKCIHGNRFVPVELIDVAGLVPKAHEGRGLGNKFLDELRRASVLIHVIDASGGTDFEGNPIAVGMHDPAEDVSFLEEEIEQWFFDIFKRGWEKVSRKVQYENKDFAKYFEEMYAGIGFTEKDVLKAVKEAEVDAKKPHDWGDERLFRFTKALRRISKPIIIAANKTDIGIALENIQKLKSKFQHSQVMPVSSMAELVLKKLEEQGTIEYIPGDSNYTVIDQNKISEKQEKALEIIDKNVLARFGNTGVQQCINSAVFEVLGKVVVFPVEDEHRFADKDGNVLPDAFLMDRGSTPRELAFKIHTEIGEHFIGAIDARTKRKISNEKELRNGDIIKILVR